MNMRKTFSLLLTVVIILSLAACSFKNNQPIENEGEIEKTETILPEETGPKVDKIGWKVNPAEVKNALPVDIQTVFDATDKHFDGIYFKPIAYLAYTPNDDIFRVLCIGAEDFSQKDAILNLYDVTIEDNKIVKVREVDMTSYMNKIEADSVEDFENFANAGWKHYMGQAKSEMPTAVRNVLPVVPEDITPIHFMAVYGEDDGTLTFAILGHQLENLVIMFISVTTENQVDLLNVTPIV